MYYENIHSRATVKELNTKKRIQNIVFVFQMFFQLELMVLFIAYRALRVFLLAVKTSFLSVLP